MLANLSHNVKYLNTHIFFFYIMDVHGEHVYQMSNTFNGITLDIFIWG
jgi:hypothetical protein